MDGLIEGDGHEVALIRRREVVEGGKETGGLGVR
jgi:hypothetical protein